MKYLFILLITIIITGCSIPKVTEQVFGAEIITSNTIDSKTINGEVKTFTHLDDNTGESIIIASDSKDYYGFSSISVPFGVKNNTAQAQDITIVISLPDNKDYKFSSLRQFIQDKTIIVPEQRTSTTTIPGYSYEEAEWANIVLSNFTPKIITRKDNLDTVSVRQSSAISFNFGEIKYFVARIGIPNGIEGDEFFIETFGSLGAYGHLDPAIWTAKEDFESYADTDILTGKTGGTGWSAAWDETFEGGTTQWTVTNGQAVEGSLSAYWNPVASAITGEHRTLTTQVDTDNSTVYVSIRMESTSGRMYLRYKTSSAATRIQVQFNTSGNIVGRDNATDRTIPGGSSYSSATWIRVGVEFDFTNNKWRANIDNGTFSDWWDTVGANSYTEISQFHVEGWDAGDVWVDFISADATIPVASVNIPARQNIIWFN